MKKFISLIVIIAGLLTGAASSTLVQSFQSPLFIENTPNTIQATPVQKQKDLPKEFIISKLGINTKIEQVGEDKNGKMDVPKDENNVGWYNLGVAPGSIGSSVIAGHYDSYTGPAVFYKLSDLEKGDEVVVKKESGKLLTFKVIKKEVYSDNAFPIEKVFGLSDKPYLNLITCAGIFDKNAKNYSQRVVVFTELASIKN